MLGEGDLVGEGVSVLVVSGDAARRREWGGWLARQGFSILECPGPAVRGSCPRLEGLRCPLRELADLAVLDLQRGGTGVELPAARWCATVPDDGRTVFVVPAGVEASLGGGQRVTQASRDSLFGAVRRAGHRPRWACAARASATRR